MKLIETGISSGGTRKTKIPLDSTPEESFWVGPAQDIAPSNSILSLCDEIRGVPREGAL